MHNVEQNCKPQIMRTVHQELAIKFSHLQVVHSFLAIYIAEATGRQIIYLLPREGFGLILVCKIAFKANKLCAAKDVCLDHWQASSY